MNDWAPDFTDSLETERRHEALDDLEDRERSRWERLYERGGDTLELRVEQLMQCAGLDRDEAELVVAKTRTCPDCGRPFVNAGAHGERCDGRRVA